MLKIGHKSISESSPTFIIAEVGVNHNGSKAMAEKLIEQTYLSGADAVKFQMFRSESLASEQAELVKYQRSSRYQNQQDMLKQLELKDEDFIELKAYCDQRGILFLSTPFDQRSALFLQNLGMKAFKIGSGDITHFSLLSQIQSYGKPILLSTGMSTLGEIEATLNFLKQDPHVALLHCTSSYPAPFEDLHLRVINTLQNAFARIIGYSDHSLGIEVPFAATAMGYKIIEKHFTLDRTLEGPDHSTSLEPAEFKQMVRGIRRIELALGSSRKHVATSETSTKENVRRGIYLSKDLQEGHLLKENDLLYLRPVHELEASYYQQILGKKLTRSKLKGEALQWKDVREE